MEQNELVVHCSRSHPPLGTLLTLRVSGFSLDKSVRWREEKTTELSFDGATFRNDATIARFIAQASIDSHKSLLGASFNEETLIEAVVSLVEQWNDGIDEAREELLRLCSESLGSEGFFLANRLTLADILLFTVIVGDKSLQVKKPFSILFNRIKDESAFSDIRSLLGYGKDMTNGDCQPLKRGDDVKSKLQPQETKTMVKSVSKEKMKDEGKFVELPGAEKGKVVVRFPPEASGYLHIGHAKAVLLNQYYQQTFDGQLIMRFDDTNPAKENAHFEKVIIEDLRMLKVEPNRWTHTSDHFDILLEMCERLIKENKAYVDDTDGETMKKERETRTESKCRNQSVEMNIKLWEEMKRGTAKGQKCCARVKIDMKSNNGALRDPTIYRCKAESHVRTGDKYKVYPTYDFACPIVDSLEGVTHALRTTEYHDRDDQYYFICDALQLRKPHIWEYSRLNMTNTVMSKRHLTWFVNEGIVDGWNDPRLPTVRGVMRRGMTVEGLKQFIVAQGGSRAVVTMEWDKLWAFNKKVIDPVAPRFTALDDEDLVIVQISDAQIECKSVPLHPKDATVGEKMVWFSSRIRLEQADARSLNKGDMVTLINWGNVQVEQVDKDEKTGRVVQLIVKLRLDNKDYKKTPKVTWISIEAENSPVAVISVDYDHIISKAVVSKEEDWKQYINYDSRHYRRLIGESALRSVRQGDIVQLQRKGFFICDRPYQPASPYSQQESPLVLVAIPDGHVKETLTNKTPTLITTTDESTKKTKTDGDQSTKKMDGDQLSKKTDGDQSTKKTNGDQSSILLVAEIETQGETVRTQKAIDPKSPASKEAINKLLELKKRYKELTGMEYKPGMSTVSSPPPQSSSTPTKDLGIEIDAQGLKVTTKDLGTEIDAQGLKADTKAAIAKLLELKKNYKTITGKEYQSGSAPAPQSIPVVPVPISSGLADEIEAQGLLVRDMKAKDAKSAETKAAIAKLLDLKKQYKESTGEEYKSIGATSSAEANKTKRDDQNHHSNQKDQVSKIILPIESKKQTKLGLGVTKEENYSEWYSQVITKAELVEYYDVSGCYVLRPWSFSIWEHIKHWFDVEIKKMGIRNCYFPMFVSQSALEREKTHIADFAPETHIADFAPEVAWVTRAGQSELAEPIAIRPTSETVMYPSFAKWVQSHRDLPIRLNQWCNVVRWEFKHPTPFLRTREFLWQEGHTAFANQNEAEKEVFEILELYAKVYTDLMAIPVVKGRKTEREKFAGGDFTTTVEAYVAVNGRGIQGGTSHHLGQNFSKMFDICFEDAESKKTFAFQNSWGLSTRTIGALIMIHGDDAGLVLPPRVAAVQVIVIPVGITAQSSEEQRKSLTDTADKVSRQLAERGMRAETDLRDNYSPGWKFNHWELKGVPIRVEVGPRDLAANQVDILVNGGNAKVTAVIRHSGEKKAIQLKGLDEAIEQLLVDIHGQMYDKALKERDTHMKLTREWSEFRALLENKFILLTPFCEMGDCEDAIKRDSARDETADGGAAVMGAKSLCIPLQQPNGQSLGDRCIHPSCQNKPKSFTLFGRSY